MKCYKKVQINEIADSIKAGMVVALPTETVYGLAVSADDVLAIKKLNLLKNRESSKVYSLMVADTNQISKFIKVDEFSSKIIAKYLPGELTIVLPKNPNYKNMYFEDYTTIGIRVPDDSFLRKLLKAAGPMVVTSANLSGEEPCLSSEDVERDLSGVDVVVEGEAGGNPPTTVIECKDSETIIHRQGRLVLSGSDPVRN